MDALLSYAQKRQDSMLKMLHRFVEFESPSTDKPALDRFGKLVGSTARRINGRVRIYRSAQTGNHLRAEFRLCPSPTAGQILLLGHLDTVWELGTIRRMPFRLESGRAFGPGVFDMKSGIVSGLYALRSLRALRIPIRKQVVLLLTADEEIGSPSSRPIIEREALQSDCVLVLEPAHGLKGYLKTARKGVGEFEIRVKGKAAHAGLDPDKGASAILELCRQVLRVGQFADPRKGITTNAGLISGGTRPNVVAAEAAAKVDVRIARIQDMRKMQQKFHSLKPYDHRTTLEINGGFNRPPWERSRLGEELYERARRLAQTLGINLSEVAVGGGSDGNFTAALGIPTLDGLGAVGEGAHALHENIVVDEMPRRSALLAHLIASLGDSEQ